MTWVETHSASFSARHEGSRREEAQRLLWLLEETRARLESLFPHTTGDLTVVLHSSSASLTASNPLVALRRAVCAPAARRYLAGWSGSGELHVLDAHALAERASRVPGSREMLELTPAALYARHVIEACNPDLPRRTFTPRRLGIEMRWSWLLEGAARYFAGQTVHARPAIARRLREGPPPGFPPPAREAILLGGTVFDLLARERDVAAAVALSRRLHPQGPRAALAEAFGGRSLLHTEGAWRTHLARIAAASGRVAVSEPG